MLRILFLIFSLLLDEVYVCPIILCETCMQIVGSTFISSINIGSVRENISNTPIIMKCIVQKQKKSMHGIFLPFVLDIKFRHDTTRSVGFLEQLNMLNLPFKAYLYCLLQGLKNRVLLQNQTLQIGIGIIVTFLHLLMLRMKFTQKTPLRP